MNDWVTYLVRCSDGSLYCGATNNVEKRVATHNKGKGAKYTKFRLPVVLVMVSKLLSKVDALKLERAVKKHRTNEKINYLRKFSGDGVKT